MPGCYLESDLSDGESVYRIPLTRFPALIGRETGLAVTLQSSSVSRQHAEILDQDNRLVIHDLGSTNGTFVNHEQVADSRELCPGDVIRFADVEFRLYIEPPSIPRSAESESTVTEFFSPHEHVNRIPVGAQQLEVLLREKMINPLYQSVVSAEDGGIKGLELLGRGNHPELSELPVPLFFLADSLGCAIELSEIIRDVGVEAWGNSAFRHIPLFMNTHPGELNDCCRLVDSLQALHDSHPDLPMVLEIHEQAVTDTDTLSKLHRELQQMGIQIAYDDFGAGQARLLELLNTPPYAVKFDISLIRDIDKVSRDHQDMIGLLVSMVRKGSARALAEGVSRAGELAVCRDLGFDLIQGFLYGQPVPLDELNKLQRGEKKGGP